MEITLTTQNQFEIKTIAKKHGHTLSLEEARQLYMVAAPETRMFLNRYLPENLKKAGENVPLNPEFQYEDLDEDEELIEVGGVLYSYNECVDYGFLEGNVIS
jgi:hypothetical protein